MGNNAAKEKKMLKIKEEINGGSNEKILNSIPTYLRDATRENVIDTAKYLLDNGVNFDKCDGLLTEFITVRHRERYWLTLNVLLRCINTKIQYHDMIWIISSEPIYINILIERKYKFEPIDVTYMIKSNQFFSQRWPSSRIKQILDYTRDFTNDDLSELLCCAVYHNRLKCVKILLGHGADPNFKSQQLYPYSSSIDLLLFRGDSTVLEIFKYFGKYNMDVTHRTYDLAVKNDKHTVTCKRLLNKFVASGDVCGVIYDYCE